MQQAREEESGHLFITSPGASFILLFLSSLVSKVEAVAAPSAIS